MNVSEKLRLVQGLHSHAAMFGFNWSDDSNWTWHDVACKIADEIDAENDQLKAENKQLKADNAMYREKFADSFIRLLEERDKLREDLEFERSENGWVREFLNRMGPKCGTKDCPSLVAYVDKLELENDKLREMVVRMARVLDVDGESCNRDCEIEFGCKYICRIADAMHELGIESWD